MPKGVRERGDGYSSRRRREEEEEWNGMEWNGAYSPMVG